MTAATWCTYLHTNEARDRSVTPRFQDGEVGCSFFFSTYLIYSLIGGLSVEIWSVLSHKAHRREPWNDVAFRCARYILSLGRYVHTSSQPATLPTQGIGDCSQACSQAAGPGKMCDIVWGSCRSQGYACPVSYEWARESGVSTRSTYVHT